MAIALGILKWVGIILGGLVGLLLLLLLLVLFVPVRYRIDGTLPETELTEGAAEKIKETAKLSAGFSWLLHAVRGSFRYPEQTSFTVKALMFTIIGGEEKEEKEQEKKKDKKKKEKKKEKKEEKKPEKKEEKKAEPAAEKKAEPAPEQKEEKAEKEEKKVVAERREQPRSETRRQKAVEKKEEEEDKASFLARVFGGIKNLLLKPYEVAQKIFYTISSVCGKIRKVRDLLESDTFARAKAAAIKHAGRILRGVLPKQSDVRVLYGTGDPYLDAEILAAYSILSPLLSAFLRPEADFERRVAGAEVHIRGRVTGATLLWNGAMLYFNKDIKAVRRRIEKIRGEEDEPESKSV
ncbi:MAG: hypothetical protein IK016_09865 [Lachnospiraceae bacterium]|nr:hypothetical protein [Lachnospiraceae bacterium]